MTTISNKALFRAYTISAFIFLFSLLCTALFENIFTGISFLIIFPILTIVSSIYFVRKKLIKENKKILLILPSAGFIVALILSIVLQIYFVNVDPGHNGQISIDMIWPFFSLAYIAGTIVINFILALILSSLLNFDKIEFREDIIEGYKYKISLLYISSVLFFIVILYTPELKNKYFEIQIKNAITKISTEDKIIYCEGLDSLTKKDYCFKLIGEGGLLEYLDKGKSYGETRGSYVE